MKRGLYLCLAAVLFLMSGCRHYSNPSMERNLVTKIIITGETEEGSFRLYYDSPEKMRLVLLYIRCVRRGFQTPEDPTSLEGPSISITTISADDTQKVYRQKNDRFFQIDNGAWQELDPEKGRTLWELLQLLPSDPEQPQMRSTLAMGATLAIFTGDSAALPSPFCPDFEVETAAQKKEKILLFF